MPKEIAADPNATAYATADQADTKAELRVGGAAWLGLSSDQKDAALATGTNRLDALDWIGDAADADQPFDWPRVGTEYSSDAWPMNVVDATIELAFSYVPTIEAIDANDALRRDVINPSLKAANIKRDKVGPLETEYFAPLAATNPTSNDGLADLPLIVQQLVRPLVRVAALASATYGTGVAIRAS